MEVLPNAAERGGITRIKSLDQILGLLLVLFEAGASGKFSGIHTNLLSTLAWSPPESG
jgi:hypothetical protein